MKIPRSISKLIDSFQGLPGIGPKSAQRLTFHLLRIPQDQIERFANALTGLKQGTIICGVCKNVGEEEICAVCSDNLRDHAKIIVVANPMDAFAIEKTGYNGIYHVLHGLIDPLNGIGPEELFIDDLIQRIGNYLKENDDLLEVILATNTSMEGESTAMYISNLIKKNNFKLTLSRIARGLPVGGDIEYADEVTLSRALEGRVEF
ncbi:recombination protein RecR [candidate division WWE3 bacterium RBG_19FT_COMBO_34_6]|uniref:Recombination protein RecR n=1 Tax=candidate division WWE3 bacterium RBG_19FT_COMBO_34_6 TaxID=1802612 RepID=A0A1F4UMW8_UNCKA|nr:MAG: recombination protein RecR [candidate division WWE3 bacterium RBG_19FT_COMBO_34_6]